MAPRSVGFAPTVRGGVRFGTFGGFGNFGGSVFFPGRFHHHHRFFFGSEFFFPGSFWPYYYPYYSYPMVSYSNPSSDYSGESSYQVQMTRELDRLTYEVERLREQQESSAYATAPAAPPRVESRPEAARPTVLVFQDKHIQEVENYAIVGQTLWLFSEQRAKKVPLSELDIPATTKLNDERGIEFRVPGR